MTKKQDTADQEARNLDPQQQASEIVNTAVAFAAMLQGELSEEWRGRIEKRLAEALMVLRPKWSVAMAKSHIEKAFTIGAEKTKEGKFPEATAVEYIARAIGNLTAMQDAPLECWGKTPEAATIQNCFLAFMRGRGAPRPGVLEKGVTKYDALLSVYRELGLSGADSGEAIKKQMQRERPRPK